MCPSVCVCVCVCLCGKRYSALVWLLVSKAMFKHYMLDGGNIKIFDFFWEAFEAPSFLSKMLMCIVKLKYAKYHTSMGQCKEDVYPLLTHEG